MPTLTHLKRLEAESIHIMRVVAGGAWKDSRTIEFTWCFNESSFRDTIVCRFDGKHMTFDRSVNVNSTALFRPTVRGIRG